MTNRKALKCTLGVLVAALFLAVTWSAAAARLSTTGGTVGAPPLNECQRPNGSGEYRTWKNIQRDSARWWLRC